LNQVLEGTVLLANLNKNGKFMDQKKVESLCDGTTKPQVVLAGEPTVKADNGEQHNLFFILRFKSGEDAKKWVENVTQKDKTLDLASSEDLARFLMNKLGKKQNKWVGIFDQNDESLRSDDRSIFVSQFRFRSC